MKGRPPKSTSKHEKEGTYDASRHRDRLSFPTVDDTPKPPDYFTDGQTEKWNLFCRMLKRDGMLSDTYLELLERYCNAWQRWWEAKLEVDSKGLTFETDSGQVKQNPAVSVEKEMLSLMLRILQDFGYTPRASMSIKVPGGEEKESALSILMKRHGN